MVNNLVDIYEGQVADKIYESGQQVYGRNLILNSDFENASTNVNIVNSGRHSVSTDYSYKGNQSVKVSIEPGATSSDSGVIIRLKSAQPNATYTATGWLYSDVSRTLNISGYSADWADRGRLSVALAAKTWTKFEYHFTTEASVANAGIAAFVNGTTGIDIQPFYIDMVKTEQGNQATPWSPAPEDEEFYTAPSTWSPNMKDDNYYQDMLNGTLSVYKQLTLKYESLLATYAGQTDYDRVKSLIADDVVMLFLEVKSNVSVTINGIDYLPGVLSIPVDKDSIAYTDSDIVLPIVIRGKVDARIYYAYGIIDVRKQVPGLGTNLISSQMDTSIPKP